MKCARIQVVVALLAWSLASQVLAEKVLILYPQVKEPYAKIYQDTLDGIGRVYRDKPTILVINPGEHINPSAVVGPTVIVALGNDAARALGAVEPQVPVITTDNQDISFKVRRQLAYYPDPDTLLDNLRRYQPEIRTLLMVAESDTDPYQQRVRESLARDGLGLKVCVAQNLTESARCYRELLDAATARDAIWILHGGRLLEPALLTNILATAWERQLTVLSSNPDHVRRGALLSLYPDNISAGRQLGAMIAACLAPGSCTHSEVSYLRVMGIAFNERTSRHLGLNVSPEARTGADLLL